MINRIPASKRKIFFCATRLNSFRLYCASRSSLLFMAEKFACSRFFYGRLKHQIKRISRAIFRPFSRIANFQKNLIFWSHHIPFVRRRRPAVWHFSLEKCLFDLRGEQASKLATYCHFKSSPKWYFAHRFDLNYSISCKSLIFSFRFVIPSYRLCIIQFAQKGGSSGAKLKFTERNDVISRSLRALRPL